MGLTERELCPNGRNDLAAVLPPANPLPWFAVVIKPRHERAVLDGLSQKGLESFLPQYWAARAWSDRVKRLQLPLFPGYVFCRFEYGRRLPVLRTPGVRSIVSFGAEAIPVRDEDIERIRRMVTSGCSVEPWPFLKDGQRVRVADGPLTGLEGTLTGFRGTWRVVVGLDLLQRSVAVQLARDQITPLE
jgi:transcription antitermination factor NusG